MDINSYSMYSATIQNEIKNNSDLESVQDLIKELKNFDDDKDVKAWLLEAFGIKEDISNLAIANNILISTNSKEQYYNVTVVEDKKVKSYNFKKGDLS